MAGAGLVSVPARQTYADPVRPFLPQMCQGEPSDMGERMPGRAHEPGSDIRPALSAQQQQDDVLDLLDVTGKRIISVRLHHSVTIREENAAAALEVMSRFAVNPKWLIYLPPTMSPTETTQHAGLLEHPQEAFDYFRGQGVAGSSARKSTWDRVPSRWFAGTRASP